MSREAVIDHLLAHFAGRYGLRRSPLQQEEMAKAARLVQEKFTTSAWTAAVP